MSEQRPDSQKETEYSEKSRSTAGNLGIMLGPVGAHRFYLGYHHLGLLQIALTVLTLVGALWGIYEGITILWGAEWKDAKGKRLRPSSQVTNKK